MRHGRKKEETEIKEVKEAVNAKDNTEQEQPQIVEVEINNAYLNRKINMILDDLANIKETLEEFK